MSEHEACLWLFGMLCITILLLLVTWRVGKFGGPSTIDRFNAAAKRIAKAKTRTEKLMVYSLAVLFLFKSGMSVIGSVIVALIGVIGMVGFCAPPDSVAQRIIWDLYERCVQPKVGIPPSTPVPAELGPATC